MRLSEDRDEGRAAAVSSAQAPLRERQILMVQQCLYNAGVVTSEERRKILTTCTGRSVTSLRDLRQGELRLILKHLCDKSAARAQ